MVIWFLLWAQLAFENRTQQLGFQVETGFSQEGGPMQRMFLGGIAVGDVERDGWLDVFITSGDAAPNYLFRNMGGYFVETANASGVALPGFVGSSPSLADFNGDGCLDLFLGAIEGDQTKIFQGNCDGSFSLLPFENLEVIGPAYSCSHADMDRDGDLDIILSFWDGVTGDPGTPGAFLDFLWQNDGGFQFTNVDVSSGLSGPNAPPFSFTGNFLDLNGDSWPDICYSSDFGTSKSYINQGDGTFLETNPGVFTDENGMGATCGDYDNDGDMDWFVTSIWDPNGVPEGNWGITGNRLYQNQGDGTFVDVSEAAGVRQGYWGWGASFADFDNDGFLDIVHVNGFSTPEAFEFHNDPSRLFLNNGDGTFSEVSAASGFVDTKQGRGVACFDYDRDGDLDLLIGNNNQSPDFFENKLLSSHKFLIVQLKSTSPNPFAVGTKVEVEIGAQTLTRVVQTGNNFQSHNPMELHFGLGNVSQVDTLRLTWPDDSITELSNLQPNQFLNFEKGQSPGPCSEFPGLVWGNGVVAWSNTLNYHFDIYPRNIRDKEINVLDLISFQNCSF